MKFLIPVVVGGIIGYFTNWLAIKMLFRPLEEKRILGYRLAFTPGLIPKERERIAKNIGSSVGVHLLSTETIVKSLENQKIEEKINNWIEKKVNLLKDDQTSIDDLLTSIFKENKDYFLDNTKEKILDLVIKQKARFKNAIGQIIEDKISSLETEKIYLLVEDILKAQMSEFANSKALKDKIQEV